MHSGRKLILLEQLISCHDDEGWFASLQTALDGLDAKWASWKANEATHSVWEIVEHLIFWNQRYLDRFNGVPVLDLNIENKETFQLQHAEITDEEWQATVGRLHRVLVEWREVLTSCAEEKLDESVRANSNEPIWQSLSHANIHNANHIGQIIYIRKLQGSWNPEGKLH